MLWHPTDTSISDILTSTTHPMSLQDVQEQPSVLGILNDWDMASHLTGKGEVPNSATLHRGLCVGLCNLTY